jgi:hypothetical protein
MFLKTGLEDLAFDKQKNIGNFEAQYFARLLD